LQRLLHLKRQTVHAATHIDAAARQPGPHTGRRNKHRRTAAITRRSAAKPTSTPVRLRLITSNLGTPALQQATADLMAAHDIGKGGARPFNFRDNPELLLQRPMAATLDASDDLHPNIRLGSLGHSYKRR
jgi:hypothetical protein